MITSVEEGLSDWCQHNSFTCGGHQSILNSNIAESLNILKKSIKKTRKIQLQKLAQIEMGPHGNHQLSNKSSKSVHPFESSELTNLKKS